MTQPQSAFQRGWRPSLMWWLLITIAFPFGLLIAALILAFVYGVWRTVLTGEPMPDLFVGIERLPWQVIAGGFGALMTGYLARGRQIVLQDRANGGGQDRRVPFEPSSPPPTASIPEASSPTGGLVNNEAIE